MISEPNIETRFNDEMLQREARAEKFACVLWVSVIIITYVLLMLSETFNTQLRANISLLVAFTVPSFVAIYLFIHFVRYHPLLAYFNSFLQLSVVSGAIYFDTLAYGTQYALSSMPPIAYGLVIIVTAFRLRPAMGIFAGTMAAAQFLALYAWVMRDAADMSAQVLADIPSLDWAVTYMKVVILIGLGAAGSFSAYSLRKELSNFMTSARQEVRLHYSLGRYLSNQVADALVAGEDGTIPTRKRNAAIMFCDIRNFTQFSNTHGPDHVANTLNAFFDLAATSINDQKGVINKFLGDGFLAVFGLFETDEDPRVSATRAAFDIIESTCGLLEAHDLGVGISLNYGEVIAGEVGSEGRCEFTVIGNTVNVAARLEGLNRGLQTKLVVTKAFFDSLPKHFAQGRSCGTHEIRGVAGETEVIELTGLE